MLPDGILKFNRQFLFKTQMILHIMSNFDHFFTQVHKSCAFGDGSEIWPYYVEFQALLHSSPWKSHLLFLRYLKGFNHCFSFEYTFPYIFHVFKIDVYPCIFQLQELINSNFCNAIHFSLKYVSFFLEIYLLEASGSTCVYVVTFMSCPFQWCYKLFLRSETLFLGSAKLSVHSVRSYWPINHPKRFRKNTSLEKIILLIWKTYCFFNKS